MASIWTASHEIESPLLDKDTNKYLPQVSSIFLYYAHAIDMTILHALSAIAPDPITRTLKQVQQQSFVSAHQT